MPVSTVDDFFGVLEKSRLLSPDQLVEARELVDSANGQAVDATATARLLARESLLTRWQAGQLLAGRSAFFLGKYKLIDLLGRGGMGSVFLGEHVMMNRRVAIKVLSKQIGKEPGSLERFLAEARAIAALDHPNIVHAYNVDQEGDRYYIVMEYVDGVDLQRLVEKEGQLDYARAADYIRQAAEGLEHAHSQKIVHCDVKPSNLLVNGQDVVKILDMGLARLVGRDEPPDEHHDDSILGSVDYLSPEQAVGSPDFDHRADIYSLGCTLYYLLTGHPPFPEGTLPERIMKHQNDQPKPIGEAREGAPAELTAVCEKMMAKEPADRYASAGEVAQALAGLRLAIRKPKRAPAKKTESQEMAAVAAGAPAGFSIDAGKKPSGKRAPAAKKSDSNVSADAAAPAEPAVSLWSTPKGKGILIGGAAGAVLLLLIGGVGIGMMLASGGDKSVAVDQNASPAQPRTARGIDPNEVDLDLPSKPDEPPKPADAPADPEKPATEVAAVTPTAPAPDAPPPAETAQPDPPKPEEPKPEQKPPEQKPPESKPAETKPPEKKDPPKPAAKADPFGNVVEHVALPKLPRDAPESGPIGEPVTLGKTKLAGKPLEVKLLATEPSRGFHFGLAPDPAATGKAWIIYEESKAKAERIDIARVAIDDEGSSLQWLAGAAKSPARAEQLANAGLLLGGDGKERLVSLSQPVPVAPIVVDLERPKPLPITIPIEVMPDASVLRLEITKFESEFKDVKIEPHKTLAPPVRDKSGKMDASVGETMIRMPIKAGEKGEKTIFAILRVGFAATGNRAQVRIEPYYAMGEALPPEPLRVGAIQMVLMQTSNSRQAAEAAIKANVKGLDKGKTEEQVKKLKEVGDLLSAINNAAITLNKNAKIRYRVYVDIEGRQIELVSTEATGAEALVPETTAPEPPPIEVPGVPKRFFD